MWQTVTDPAAWNESLSRFPTAHVLQSWEWGEFKSRWGWSAQRWLLSGDGGQPRAMVQLLRRSAGRLPLCVLYAPKGPTADSVASYVEALQWLEHQSQAQRAVWLKVDGDARLDGPEPLAAARAALGSRGWRYSPNQVQYRNTMHTDLRHTDQELLAAMKQKWRYNIRLAEKRGVTIRLATPEEMPLLYEMYAETGARDGFIIREPEYYYDAWRTMRAVAFLAEHASAPKPLAGLVLFRFAARAWYFYGMSRAEGREHMPNYLLQWMAMRWARDNGCDIYDWWGAPEQLDEQDSMWGVYRFKDGFGAQFVEGLGAWDYAPIPLFYNAYVRWMPAVWRMVRGARQGAHPQAV
ncbi:MAG: peptidoglycan bridge formation glycyltransferase FemA/FemB family protein [Chloroflexi bacterium]|nr:peptidoglycan bridge formation glycyltransferase FemA/FemB family protein [Chloroflexota bacterium]MCL5274001.1 peptidoglycan bridge formation glycyltransferase FemA/FemB family protein [Chloroflexota bacterium]